MEKVQMLVESTLTNVLLLNASFIENLGLMHGKMGISIFFFHLFRKTGNQIYEDYAGELIDEIYEEINNATPLDFENGLAGIGWGIEYLIQNGFVDADADEVLKEFDHKLSLTEVHSPSESINLMNGLLGIGAYFLKRIQNPKSNDKKITTLTNKQALIHFIDEFDRKTRDVLTLMAEPQVVSKTKTTEATKRFDLLWSYPVMLWFLAELHPQNIFNFKIEKIIQRLTDPLSDESNLPKLHGNGLLLALALHKLENCQTFNFSNKHERQAIMNKILTNIDRKKIFSELPDNNVTLRYGTSGITWVYHQLFQFTQNKIYNQEMIYWKTRIQKNSTPDNGFAGFDLENENNPFGLMEGLAGIGLLNN